MKRKLEGDVVVLPRDKNLVDVFTGHGWENWSLFQNTGTYLKLVAGTGVSEEDYAKLMRML